MNQISSGQKFTKLTVLAQVKGSVWRFQCECGKTIERYASAALKGQLRSCGCLKRERVIERNKATAKYGNNLARTPTMGSWSAMMSRCFNTRYHDYPDYGGAGITVCEFIRATPLNLIILIGLRPDGKSLDRINTFGSYTCGRCPQCFENHWALNVRWATATEQARNQRTNHLVEINGVSKCVAEWASELGIKKSSFRYRVKRGWTGQKLLQPKSK